MPAKTKQKPSSPAQDDIQFGRNWTKYAAREGLPGPQYINEFRRRQICARWGVGDVPRWEHRKAIIQTLWNEEDYAWTYWTDRRVKATSEHHFVTWLGPGGSSKTSDAAVSAIEWWLEQPDETAVVVASTTKEMLRTRIWGQIIHYHGIIPKQFGYCGELLDSSYFIKWKDGDWKHGIKGVAVHDGTVEEAVNNIIGMHASRVLWILDEMQGVREAIVKAIPNLLKNPETRFWGMGNPDLLTSLLCRYSIPTGGWDSIARFQDEWETDSHGYEGTGICQFFDGRKSPAILDPEWGARHPWMINQRQIDNHLRTVNGNENDPSFMTQSIGWPPSMGVESTVLDNSIISTFKCQDGVIWTDGWTASGSLDPAFNGGDKAILQFGKRGFVRHPVDGDRWTIHFEPPIMVPIDADRKDRPIHYQIVDFVKAECEKRNIKPEEFAVAAAGEGGGLVSIFQQEWGPVNAIEEGGAPSERQVDAGKTAKQAYDNRSSELCFGFREMAIANGIRGLSHEAADQFCKRQTFYRNGKWCVEPKRGAKGRTDASGAARKGFKERLGYSPDHADSCCIYVEHCRMRGAFPGSTQMRATISKDWTQAVESEDRQYSEANYVEDQDWQEYAANL